MKNSVLFILLTGILVAAVVLTARDQQMDRMKLKAVTVQKASLFWQGPDTVFLQDNELDKKIRYGRDLIAHTAQYLGPKGSVAPISNGLNCQNCHLNAGAQPWGNNFFAVHATYPQFRARSGSMETEVKRVNDCFERSMAGHPLDTTSKEMEAILAYIGWLGTNVPPGTKPKGAGIPELAFLDRAADPTKGATVYSEKCASCHGADGHGKMHSNGIDFQFPPLWGPHSYNEAAGLFRLSRFAGYVKDNMPLGATHDKPILTTEEAWDVAAFVNSQPRPLHPFLAVDWPDISGKPFDHPFGPYADPFTETQHKYGPYGPIRKFKQATKAPKATSPSSR